MKGTDFCEMSVFGQPSWTVSSVDLYSQLTVYYTHVRINHICTSWTKVMRGSCSNSHEKNISKMALHICVYVRVQFVRNTYFQHYSDHKRIE